MKKHVLYNPKTRFIDYVVPGVIGIILQLLTVTLMACTIAREREAGTLYQLMVTSLRRREIVIGKILPYLAISIVLIFGMLVAGWHFQVSFISRSCSRSFVCFSALLAGAWAFDLRFLANADAGDPALGFLFSPDLRSVRRLCAARAAAAADPLLSECFPLTHFCRAFRLVNLYGAGPYFYASDLLFMLLGARRDVCGRGGVVETNSAIRRARAARSASAAFPRRCGTR